MPDPVYQVMTLTCALVAPLPIGTDPGLLPLLWLLVSGRPLVARAPGPHDFPLPARMREKAERQQFTWRTRQMRNRVPSCSPPPDGRARLAAPLVVRLPQRRRHAPPADLPRGPATRPTRLFPVA